VRIEDYPPQEPQSENGLLYMREMLKRDAGIEGVEVSHGPDVYQRLLLFPSKQANGTVLAFMCGGGWTNGYKELLAFMAPHFNQAGITFAALGYRLAPKHIFPEGWQDAASGVAWLHRHVAEYGGDPQRIFVGGHSAGGHYAALLACRRDWQAPLGLPGNVIRGCLCLSAVYDFTPGNGMQIRPRFLGPEPLGNDVHASPLFQLGELPPPLLLANGTDDFPHLMTQAKKIERVLAVRGADVRRIELAGRNHFSVAYQSMDADSEWLPQALAWMSAH
jgi:arylformamidase